MNITYLHGLSSSGQFNTAKRLRALPTNENVATPDIPVRPMKALQLSHSLAGEYQADNTIVIGSSMCAMYASHMKGWHEKIMREHQGTKHYDGREINLHFPSLPEDTNERTVELVYGNRYCQTPSIGNYGENGVQAIDGLSTIILLSTENNG